MSEPIAILCSGQGAQSRDMFQWLGEIPEADAIFVSAAAYLGGSDPRRFVREADESALFTNHAGQILCCTQALAAWSFLVSRHPPVILAGYSVGEVAAWGCAGYFTPDQVLQCVSERAALMDRDAPEGAGLGAIVGLRRPALDRLLETHGVFVAIVNDVDSFVVGGLGDALDACLREAGLKGATARRLRVATPSHTPLLSHAGEGFGRVLEAQRLGAPQVDVRLLTGIDGAIMRDPAAGLKKLAAQISTTVQWSSCLESCREQGASVFLELGPGSALSRMAQTMSANVSARSIEQFRSARGVVDWLTRVWAP